jgi:ribosome biogenesis GTPase
MLLSIVKETKKRLAVINNLTIKPISRRIPIFLLRMTGIVVKSTGSWYQVKTESGEILACRVKGKLRLSGIKSTNPVAVGDAVEYSLNPKVEGEGIISRIHDRKNYIVRKSVNLSKRNHIIAANLDLAVLIATLDYPKTFPRFIDRFLATAEAYHIPAAVIFNKVDVYDDEALKDLAFFTVVYQTAGYEVMHVSATEKIGLEDFKGLLKDKRSLLSGHSGVGKSTLINKIEPALSIATKEISETHEQGQHTTTFAEMYDLAFGGEIIDSPGIKGFGLFDMEPEEIGDYFPEIFALKQDCKFHNCLHLEEPGCAVKKAVEENELAYTRYESYISFIKNDEDENHFRTDIYAQ